MSSITHMEAIKKCQAYNSGDLFDISDGMQVINRALPKAKRIKRDRVATILRDMAKAGDLRLATKGCIENGKKVATRYQGNRAMQRVLRMPIRIHTDQELGLTPCSLV